MNITNNINELTLNHPLAATTGLVVFVVLLQQITSALVSAAFPDLTKDVSGPYIRYAASALIFFLLWKLQSLKESGVSLSISQWHTKWPIAIIPMLLVGGINIASIEWASIEFTAVKLTGWLFDNFATGLFEEVMMRAMAFYLLYRVWKDERYGIYKAAIAQALIFGLLHLFNLRNDFTIDVVAQVIYASILGFAFAGIVAYTHSVWPAVISHAFINAMANINPTFSINYVESPTPVQMYVVFISIIVLVTALPSYFMLRSVATAKP